MGGVGAQAYKDPHAPGLAETVMEGTAEGPEAVQRATELIEQRLAQEEETEVGAGRRVLGREASRLTAWPIRAVFMGKERLATAWVQTACYFPPAQPGPFPHQAVPNVVVGGGRWGFSPSNRYREGAGLPETPPTHLGLKR